MSMTNEQLLNYPKIFTNIEKYFFKIQKISLNLAFILSTFVKIIKKHKIPQKIMRVISENIKENLKITLFSWNEKYILKFEQGLLEQTYKISQLDVYGEQEVLEILKNEDFIKKINDNFEKMRADWQILFQ